MKKSYNCSDYRNPRQNAEDFSLIPSIKRSILWLLCLNNSRVKASFSQLFRLCIRIVSGTVSSYLDTVQSFSVTRGSFLALLCFIRFRCNLYALSGDSIRDVQLYSYEEMADSIRDCISHLLIGV